MIIVCDSSPLITLSIVDKLDLLDRLFKEVLVPVSVFNELTISNKPEAQKNFRLGAGESSSCHK